MPPRLTTEEFIIKAKKVHGDKYKYGKVKYLNARGKVKIKCKKHGMFEQGAGYHLYGQGCPGCKKIGTTVTTEEFIIRAKEIHGSKYKYKKVEYVRGHAKVKIKCKEHGVFEQRANNHLRGANCPKCTSSYFNSNTPGILYYLSINHGQAYKIGITSRDIQKRFSKEEFGIIKVVETWDFDMVKDAYDMEQDILKEFEYAKYNGDPILDSGNTELFDRDVLGLDV